MDALMALFAQFDPLRPLEAAEEKLYVDWQARLDTAYDVKVLLANGIAYGAGSVTRLFTGHRGAGKTTELNRIKARLEHGVGGRRFFVSMLFSEGWVDLGEVQAEEVVFQIARQLVADLKEVGCDFAEAEFRNFWGRFRERFQAGAQLEGVELGTDPLKLNFRLKDFPSGRQRFRELLQPQLPTLFDLINEQILKPAREQLKGSFDDILVIVDELDRIPQKLLNGHGLTNHEHLFLDHAGPLRGLDCDVLYTIPIELAYSRARGRLQEAYGGQILMLPTVPVAKRGGEPDEDGLALLSEIVQRRVQEAGLALAEVFDPPDLLTEALRCSGGHVRGLFLILLSILEGVGHLPLTERAFSRGLRRAAANAALPLRERDWDLLAQVGATGKAAQIDDDVWNGLLKNRFVLNYEDDDGHWYAPNPLLKLAEPGRLR